MSTPQPYSKIKNAITNIEAFETGVLSDLKGVSNNPENLKILILTTERTYIGRWRLYILIFGLCLSLLLSTLETTIVSTSLISITNSLSGFEDQDSVVTLYHLTYTSISSPSS
jgi:hypothetical protein